MAHDWSKKGDIHNNTWYTCRNCGKEQSLTLVGLNDEGEALYRRRPKVGRCPKTKDGRPDKHRQKVLATIGDGKHTPVEIAEHTGQSIANTRQVLSMAKKKGLVTNPKRGWWELVK